MKEIYTPAEVTQRYQEIVPVYQTAFAGEPWYEQSKCEDSELLQRCISGMSALAVGEVCRTCDQQLQRPAYETGELVARFDTVGQTRPTSWYIEDGSEGTTICLAWRANWELIAREKYPGSAEMSEWLKTRELSECVWLDEVFADLDKRPKGNLRRFGEICAQLCIQLESNRLAFRTINAGLVQAARRDFGEAVSVYKREVEVPDWRDFITIELGGAK